MFEEVFHDRAVLWVAVLLYALGFAYALGALLRKSVHNAALFYTLLMAGFVLHSYGLYHRGLVEKAFPLANTFEILMVIGWSLVMLEFVIRAAFKLRLLGVFTSALAGGLGLVALAFPAWDKAIVPREGELNPWIGFHAFLGIFSYGVLALLSLTALMYLLQHYALRRRQSGGLFLRLPALTQLEDINKRLLMVAVSILSVAIMLGFANLAHHPGSVGFSKLLVALAVWVMCIVLHRLRSQKVLIASLFAWACFVLFPLALLTITTLAPMRVPKPPQTQAP